MNNDKQKLVDELFSLLEKKKAEIAQAEKPNWITNCSFPLSKNNSDRLNIQVVSEPVQLIEALSTLLEKEAAFEKANTILGEKATFKWGGFTVEEWTADFKTRLSKINIANKKRELADLESRLSKHISQEKRDEMDLADIANKLK